MKSRRILTVSVHALLLAALAQYRATAQNQPRPIGIDDITAWRSISTTALSDDGSWFGYRIGPSEGDSSVVLRQTRGDKEHTFTIGEAGGGGGRRGGGRGGESPAPATLAFSSDGKYAAFAVYPTRREAQQLRRQRRTPQNKAAIVNLATGEKNEIPNIRRFAFSGENPGWIALHKYAPPASAAAAAGGGTGRGGAGGASGPAPSTRDEGPKGSDLVLRELATGQELTLGNVSEFAFDKKGLFLAWLVDTADKTGNGIQLRDMTSGVIRGLDSNAKAVYARLAWTEEGDGFAALRGVEDREYEDKLYSVVAFKRLGAGGPDKTVFDAKQASGFPAGMSVSGNREPAWTKDLGGLMFGIAKLKKRERPEGGRGDAREEGAEARSEPPDASGRGGSAAEDDEEKVNLVLWHWKDKRLQSVQQVREQQDKTFTYLAAYIPETGKFLRLADERMRQVTPAPEHRFAIGVDEDDYELMGNLDGRRYQDLYVVDLRTGERRLAVKKSRWSMGPSPTGTHLLYYDDGHFFVYDMAAGTSTNVTRSVPTSFINTEDDHNVVRPPRPSLGWAKDGRSVLLSDGWDIWRVPIDGSAAVNLTLDGRKEQVRYRSVIDLDPEERGIDLTKPVYVNLYGEWTKKAGIGVIEPGKPGVHRLHWDEAAYGRLMKAKKAEVYLYTRETYKDAPDYYAADASLAGGRRITDQDEGREEKFPWSSGVILVDYVSAKGDKLQGALHLPANYEKGKSYPTLVYYYEKMSNTANNYSRPTANGSNTAVYTSHGYAVYNPDITYRVNDPGMSAVWCMVPAVKAAIATGVVDPKRIGIHGHSWGGYQTAFLVTQTDIFAAAVAGAPLTNMISMYSLIYKNTGGTNGAIFESSQGRFTSGPWENWEAYTRNSPVAHAKNVKTPLMILHNDQDGAVDFTQGIEYFNTLRRLQKPVVLLEYPGENHGLSRRPNQKDYTVRMKEFFDHYLKGAPMPKWLEEGVPRLEMEEHLKSRKPAPKPAPRAATTDSAPGAAAKP